MFGLGSSSQLGIGIAIRLHDKFSGPAREINKQLSDFQRLNKHSALLGAMRDYRDSSAAIATGAGALSLGMFQMVKSASEYDHAIRKVMILGNNDLKASYKDVHDFQKKMTQAYPQTTPMDFGKLLGENVRAGVTAWKELKELSDYQLAAATATDESAERVGMGILGVLKAYNMGATDTYKVGGKMVSGMSYVANGLTVAANQSMASIGDLVESMKYFAPTAMTAGMGLDQSLAIMSVMGNTNVLGSQAGVWSANALRYMVKNTGMFSTNGTLDAWKKAGIDPKQMKAMIDQGNIYGALQHTGQVMRGLSISDQLSLYQKLFGERGSRAVISAFTTKFADTQLSDALKGVVGGVRDDISKKQAAQMADDPYSYFMKIKNQAFNFTVSFFKAAMPVIKVFSAIAMAGAKFAGWLVETPIGKVLAGLVAVITPMIAVTFAFRAALLSATIALRGFAINQSVAGGFGGLLRGGLGMAGMGRVGKFGGMMSRNAAGKWMVNAGESISFGGKLYKGGQLLPAAFLAAQGLGAGGKLAGAAAGKGFIGKIAGSVAGKAIGGIAARLGIRAGLGLIPVVGQVALGIWTLVDIWKALKGDSDKEKVEQQQPQSEYDSLVAMNSMLDAKLAYKQPENFYAAPEFKNTMDNFSGALNQQRTLHQVLNINLDGTPVYQRAMEIGASTADLTNLNFELPDLSN